MEQTISIRALFLGDVRFSELSPFTLNAKTGIFSQIGDDIFTYTVEEILNDEKYVVFKVTTDECDYGDEIVELLEKDNYDLVRKLCTK